jgi:hypothetical protein
MQIDLLLCRPSAVSNRSRDFWYHGHSESELRTVWRRSQEATGPSRVCENRLTTDGVVAPFSGREGQGKL